MQNKKWYVVLFLVFLAPRLYQINEPLVDMHNVRQTQTAMIAKNLLNDNFDILHTRIDWDGNNPGIVIQEFPLYQLAVAFLWKFFGHHDIIGRLISLAFSILAAMYLFMITKILYNERIAFWSLFFFAICPISIFMSRVFMINMMALSLSIGSLYYWLLWMGNKLLRHALVGTICLTLATLINLTIVLPVVFAIGFILLKNRKLNHRTYLYLLILFVFFAGVNLLWNTYASRENALYYPQWRGDVLIRHFFGLDVSRFDLYKWFRISMYFIVFVAGIHGIILLFFSVKLMWKQYSNSNKLLLVWIFGGILYYLIFFKGLSGHNYYTLPIVPFICIMIGLSFDQLVRYILVASIFKKIIFVVFILTIPVWVYFPIVHAAEKDIVSYEAALAVKNHSQENDLILVGLLHKKVRISPNPTVLYYAERRGWNIAIEFSPRLNLQEIDSLAKIKAKYLVITYGQPRDSSSKVIKYFPFSNEFSNTANIQLDKFIESIKNKYTVVNQGRNYILFKLY